METGEGKGDSRKVDPDTAIESAKEMTGYYLTLSLSSISKLSIGQ